MMHLQQCLLWCMIACLKIANASTIVPGKVFDRFVTIWLENQDFAKAIADTNFVELKKQGILQTRYYANTHPSQPNYVAAVGGDYFGLNHDDWVRIPENVSTIVDLLDTKEISWAGYFEDLPGPGFMALGSDGKTGNGQWDYVRKHNPFISYDSINNNGSRLANILSFKAFERAIQANQVPQFVFMSPNMMNDGHNTSLTYAAEWAHRFLVPLLANNAMGNRTMVQLTWDESEDYAQPNRIVSLLLGDAIPHSLKGSVDDTYYTHFSIPATIEYNWDLPCLGRYDVGANVFQWVADINGPYKNRVPGNAANVNNSVSYPGALHNDPANFKPIPAPNSVVNGAGGQGLLESIRLTWADRLQEPTPYDGSGMFVDGDQQLPVYNVQTAAA